MNKRGFILGEFTLKTVIAVLCIILLVFLLFNLYSTFSDKSKKEQARSSLDKIKELISIASNEGKSTYVLTEPKGWILKPYPQGDPSFCGGKSCLCICEAQGLFSSQLEKCEKNGVCAETPSISLQEDIKIDGPTGVLIENGGQNYIISRNG